MRSRFFFVYQVFITIDQRCGTLESCVSRWGSPSHDEPWALHVPWLLLVMAMKTMTSSSVPGTHQALFQTLSWNPNCTENKYYYELHLKSGEWELIISGIKLKVAYFSQGHCHQRKSRSRHLSFLAMVSGLSPSPPHQGLGIFTSPCKHKREQPKSPGLPEKDCSGAIPQSAELFPGQV